MNLVVPSQTNPWSQSWLLPRLPRASTLALAQCGAADEGGLREVEQVEHLSDLMIYSIEAGLYPSQWISDSRESGFYPSQIHQEKHVSLVWGRVVMFSFTLHFWALVWTRVHSTKGTD